MITDRTCNPILFVCILICAASLILTGCSGANKADSGKKDTSAAGKESQEDIKSRSEDKAVSETGALSGPEAVSETETISEPGAVSDTETLSETGAVSDTETLSEPEAVSDKESLSGTGDDAESVTDVTEEETETEAPITLYIDGEAAGIGPVSPDSDDPLRVYITWNGYILSDLPFGEPHTVLIHQRNGYENTVRITGDEVFMESSTCDGQDCVQMGSVTRENLEMRVLGGFIICLPNMISVEVREIE